MPSRRTAKATNPKSKEKSQTSSTAQNGRTPPTQGQAQGRREPELLTSGQMMRRQAMWTTFFFFLTFLYNMAKETTTYGSLLYQYGMKSEPFMVKPIPGRGRGVVAIADIQKGQLLLKEEPLFIVPLSIDTSPTAYLADKLATLNATQRTSFYELSFHQPTTLEDEQNVPLAIFQTNGIAAGEGQVGIFPRTARLNHACSGGFNAVYDWREDEGALVVHVLRDIKKGEELLTSYTDTKRPRAERRAFLNSHYHFNCACPVCSLPQALSAASDARLVKFAQLKTQLATWAERKGDKGEYGLDGREAMDIIRTMWKLLIEEGYVSERGQLAADAARVAASHSDREAAQQWAALAWSWYSTELGEDNKLTQWMKAVAEHPEKMHPSWGLREHVKVGGPSVVGDSL